jgi:hypothetical protein
MKLPPESVVHPQFLCDFSCNINPVRPPGVLIGLLQEKYVSLGTGQKLNHSIEMQASVDIPADNPD